MHPARQSARKKTARQAVVRCLVVDFAENPVVDELFMYVNFLIVQW